MVFWDADACSDTRTSGTLGRGLGFWDVGAYVKLLLVGGNTVWRFLVQILPFVIFLLKPHFCLDLQYRIDSDTMQ